MKIDDQHTGKGCARAKGCQEGHGCENAKLGTPN
jgi:hypothetical protein